MRTTFNDKGESILYDLNLGRETSAELWIYWHKQFNAEFSIEREYDQGNTKVSVRYYPSDRGVFYQVKVFENNEYAYGRFYRPTASIPTEI